MGISSSQPVTQPRILANGIWLHEAEITNHGFDESFGYSDYVKEIKRSNKEHPKFRDDRIFARKTVDFMDRHQDQPWCVYLAFHAPQPHTRDAGYLSRYADAPQDRRGLLAAMAMQDDAVGILLEKLRELKAVKCIGNTTETR